VPHGKRKFALHKTRLLPGCQRLVCCSETKGNVGLCWKTNCCLHPYCPKCFFFVNHKHWDINGI
jgi:hypothetical protein